MPLPNSDLMTARRPIPIAPVVRPGPATTNACCADAEIRSTPRERYLDRRAAVAVFPIARLNNDHPNFRGYRHSVEIPREGLLICVVVQQDALAVDPAILADDPERIGIALGRIVWRPDRHVEIEARWPTGLDLGGDNVGILLFAAIRGLRIGHIGEHRHACEFHFSS